MKKLDSEKEESKFDAELMASCFADFQPVKKIVILSLWTSQKIVILLTLGKSKNEHVQN